jgi:hypothetical protein
MCLDTKYDKMRVIEQVIHLLESTRSSMRARRMAKYLCTDEFPIHRPELNRILYWYLRNGGTGITVQNGYWSLARPSSNSGSITFDQLVG